MISWFAFDCVFVYSNWQRVSKSCQHQVNAKKWERENTTVWVLEGRKTDLFCSLIKWSRGSEIIQCCHLDKFELNIKPVNYNFTKIQTNSALTLQCLHCCVSPVAKVFIVAKISLWRHMHEYSVMWGVMSSVSHTGSKGDFRALTMWWQNTSSRLIPHQTLSNVLGHHKIALQW